MKITAFDDVYPATLSGAGSVLDYSSGSNTAEGDVSGGGDVVGSPGDYSVVGLRSQVSLASNMGGGSIGDVLTIVQTSPSLAMFATSSNGAAATTVTSETTLSIAAAVGADTEYARQDHTHGTITPVVISAAGFVGELLVADGSSGAGLNPSEISEMDTERSTVSATLEDITGSTLDITIQQACKINVSMAFSCYTVSGGAPSVVAFALSIDGTDHQEMQRYLSGSSDRGIGAVVHLSPTLAAGTYTVKGRFRRVSGAATPGTDHVSLVASAQGHDGPILLTDEATTDYIYADIGA